MLQKTTKPLTNTIIWPVHHVDLHRRAQVMSQNKKFLVFAVGEPQEKMDSWPSIVVVIPGAIGCT